LEEYEDNVIDHLPPNVNVINRHPLLRRLQEAKDAGTQKREHLVAHLQEGL